MHEEIVTTGILLFDFELSIGERCTNLIMNFSENIVVKEIVLIDTEFFKEDLIRASVIRVLHNNGTTYFIKPLF